MLRSMKPGAAIATSGKWVLDGNNTRLSRKISDASEQSGDPTQERLLLDMIPAWGSFLPRCTVDQMQKWLVQAKPGDELEELPGTTSQAAMLFADASGFTALTERLALKPDGAELMCQIMNRFFRAVIAIVTRYRGDVLKFAGDSVFCAFEVGQSSGDASDLRSAVGRAAYCACALHRELHDYVAWREESDPSQTINLSLHIGVGCGTLTTLHLGGHHGRWHYVLAGEPVRQATMGEPLAKSGETAISPEAWELISDIARGDLVVEDAANRESTAPELHETSEFRLLSAVEPTYVTQLQPTSRVSQRLVNLSPDLLPLLRRYVPISVAPKLQEGYDRDVDLSEMRAVSVMFINLEGVDLAADRDGDTAAALSSGQAVVLRVQEEVHRMEGQVNKMLVDDKGTVMLCAFGLPPRPHSDDPFRAVSTAMALAEQLSGTEVGSPTSYGRVSSRENTPVVRLSEPEEPMARACIGVGSGRAFCGVVGSQERREFTVMGDVVNVAARLMGHASKPDAPYRVLVDEQTQVQSQGRFAFKALKPVKLKGKAQALPLAAPLKEIEPVKIGTTIGKQGRDYEHRQLHAMVAELLVYHGGGLILLLGTRGSGKNALAKALGDFGAKGQFLVLKSAFHAEKAHKNRKASTTVASNPSSAKESTSMSTETSRRSVESRKSLESPGIATANEKEGVAVPPALGFLAWREVLEQLLRKLVGAQPGSTGSEILQDVLAAEEALASVGSSQVKEKELIQKFGLKKYAWMMTELVPHCEQSLRLPKVPAAHARDELTQLEHGKLMQAMIVGLLRHASKTRRVMVLIQLVTGTSRDQDVDVWSWRTALDVVHECTARTLQQVVLCLVTRPINQLQEKWRESAAHETESIFAELTAEAERTSSYLKLMPLSVKSRERYVLQVLRERYDYTGELESIPRSVLDFLGERAGGNPKYIEEVLDALIKADVLQLELDDQGDQGGVMVVQEVSAEALRAVPTPAKMRATVLQQFDTLQPQLQRVLKTVSPLDAFSEAMLSDMGLPKAIQKKLPLLLRSAQDEGILEEVDPVPASVLEADPGAKQAWRWLLHLMREEVLQSLLHAERQRVEERVAEMRAYQQRRQQEQALIGETRSSVRMRMSLAACSEHESTGSSIGASLRTEASPAVSPTKLHPRFAEVTDNRDKVIAMYQQTGSHKVTTIGEESFTSKKGERKSQAGFSATCLLM